MFRVWFPTVCRSAWATVGYSSFRLCHSSGNLSVRINDMMESFGEARELIKDSLESAGSTYFSEDIEDAIAETNKTLEQWEGIKKMLKDQGEEEKLRQLINENEMKMKQLKEELEMAKHAGED
ncbi:hypothetical protein ADEAN_000169600 [Angomonas deanei]|uniref:Uncharacterized protein n=1 Tax=Angomonas deanei TaxID=59799 RepID=A0A7G2C4W6_9TRYP|nr:hypothetical protein ADEAN_000169600 [Angomonas deanei]